MTEYLPLKEIAKLYAQQIEPGASLWFWCVFTFGGDDQPKFPARIFMHDDDHPDSGKVFFQRWGATGPIELGPAIEVLLSRDTIPTQ